MSPHSHDMHISPRHPRIQVPTAGRRRAAPRRRNVAGFSLIDVLVALFVLSVGLVSVAALQFTSKRTNYEAVQRATAAALAQEMFERMRANPEYLFRYTAMGAGMVLPSPFLPYPPTGPINCAAAGANCNPNLLSFYDLSMFQGQLTGAAEKIGATNVGGLHLPIACIRFVGAGPSVGPPAPPTFPLATSVAGEYEVAIAWRGQTRLAPDSAVPGKNNCGAGNANYNDPSIAGPAGVGVFRRVLNVRTYIDVSPPAGVLTGPGV